ncbi:MAG: phenol hydroxylase subunit P4 [Azonexaceae bacterium]|uniref:phenol hydroxylase subunit P4 n=1 Tax=Azonexus sp. R2A61 TaxID=2744443 RepID=UPI001F3F7E5E|nr:phenol hydroxylase subunit P4 [Azonexus sp. R2A61]MCE1240069.1 phenol hydroxylase subunit P4 [Azonexaceae bacterium]
MAVKALYDYHFPAADTQDKFHGNQLLYVGWDDHLMFCAPFAYCLPPETKFSELVEQHLPHSYGRHPDWAKIDFSTVRWLKSGQPFVPDMNKTLAEQGLRHKDALRLQTPGLNGNGTYF